MAGAVVSAAEALQAACAAGVKVAVDGEDLILEAAAPPPPVVLELLSRDKPKIVALLSPCKDGWTAGDWQGLFAKRIMLARDDGTSLRVDAEAQALNYCVIEWLNRHPIRTSPDCCCWCGGTERKENVLLPFGCESTGHAWLHSACWRQWHESRRAEAAAALTTMGIGVRTEFPNDFGKNGDA